MIFIKLLLRLKLAYKKAISRGDPLLYYEDNGVLDGTDNAMTGKYVPQGVYTIVEVKSGKGSEAEWGSLKSSAGWLSLDYCQCV